MSKEVTRLLGLLDRVEQLARESPEHAHYYTALAVQFAKALESMIATET